MSKLSFFMLREISVYFTNRYIFEGVLDTFLEDIYYLLKSFYRSIFQLYIPG